MCFSDSVQESEANNDTGSADSVPITAGGTASFCGVIDSATDVDYLTFTLPAGVTEMGLHRYGDTTSPNSPDLQATPSIDGTDFPFGGPYPTVQTGKPYYLKVFTKAKAPIKYRIVICAHGGSCP